MTLQIFAPQQAWRKQVATRFGALPTAWVVGSKTFDPPSIADGAQTTTTVTVTGAALGNVCLTPSFSLDTQGLVLTGQVTAADTVTVTFSNNTGGAVDLASGTLTASVLQ